MGEEKALNQEELAGLFYKAINRRPLIDVTQDEEEQKVWQKSFTDANDITLYSWRNDWLKNIADNLKHFGHFNRERSVKVFHNELLGKPVILVGAGPSLEGNLSYLHLAKEKGIKILATHHALMYLARDEYKIKPDFVCVLDAGKMWDEYFAFDKLDCQDVPLLADITCNSDQLKKWAGPVYFFKSAQPDKGNIAKFLKMEIERTLPETQMFPSILETGGHAMGAAFALGKGIMEAETVIFTGADYCFHATSGKFYPFDHKIDQVVDGADFGSPGKELPAPPPAGGEILDIFGNRVMTCSAYLGFKNVMDLATRLFKATSMSQNGNLDIINATEGGALGSLMGGNSKWLQYLRLEDAIHYAINKEQHFETIRKQKESKSQ